MRAIQQGAGGDGNLARGNVRGGQGRGAHFHAVVIQADDVAGVQAIGVQRDVQGGRVVAGDVVGVGGTGIRGGLQIDSRGCRRNRQCRGGERPVAVAGNAGVVVACQVLDGTRGNGDIVAGAKRQVDGWIDGQLGAGDRQPVGGDTEGLDQGAIGFAQLDDPGGTQGNGLAEGDHQVVIDAGVGVARCGAEVGGCGRGGVDRERDHIGNRRDIARCVGGGGADMVHTIGKRCVGREGPVAAAISGGGADQVRAIIDLDGAVRFGGAAEGGRVVVGGAGWRGDHRRGGWCAVDIGVHLVGGWAGVASGILLGGGEVVGSIGKRCAGREGPVAVGIHHGGAEGIIPIFDGDDGAGFAGSGKIWSRVVQRAGQRVDHRRARRAGVNHHGVGIGVDGLVAGRVGGIGAEAVAAIGQGIGGEGPLAAAIGGGGADLHAVVVDGNQAVGLGGTGDGKDVGAGDLVGGADTVVGSNQGDHWLGWCHGINDQVLRGGCGAGVAVLIGRLGVKLVGAVLHRCGGREGPVAVGIGIGGANQVVIGIVDIHLAVGGCGAVHGGGVIVGGCQRGDCRGVGHGGVYIHHQGGGWIAHQVIAGPGQGGGKAMAAGRETGKIGDHGASSDVVSCQCDGGNQVRTVVDLDGVACHRARGNLDIKVQVGQVGLVVGAGSTGVGSRLQVHGRAARVTVGGEVPIRGVGNTGEQVPGNIADHARANLHMVVGGRAEARGRGDGQHITAHRNLAGVERNHPVGVGGIIEDGDAAEAAQYHGLIEGDRDRAWRADGGVVRGVGRC